MVADLRPHDPAAGRLGVAVAVALGRKRRRPAAGGGVPHTATWHALHKLRLAAPTHITKQAEAAPARHAAQAQASQVRRLLHARTPTSAYGTGSPLRSPDPPAPGGNAGRLGRDLAPGSGAVAVRVGHGALLAVGLHAGAGAGAGRRGQGAGGAQNMSMCLGKGNSSGPSQRGPIAWRGLECCFDVYGVRGGVC